MKEVIKRHLTSPNNTPAIAKKILQKYGFDTGKGNGNKGVVNVHNYPYTFTITSYEKDYPDARQYDAKNKGIVTLWLRDGNFYLFDRNLIEVGTITREKGINGYNQLNTDYKFTPDFLLNGMRVLTREEYRAIVEEAINELDKPKILDYI